MPERNQDYASDFKNLQTRWISFISRLGIHQQDLFDYKNLQNSWTDLFDRMNRHIYDFQHNIQRLEAQTKSQQEELQQLQTALKELHNEKEQLTAKYTEALSKLAQSNRATTHVYTAGKSFQPVIVGRDYSQFVEQTVPSCIRMILKYFQETIPPLIAKSRMRDLKNRMISVIAQDLLSTDAGPTKEIAILSQHICEVLNISTPSFSEELNKELADLAQEGQELVNAITQSDGKLVFYENVQFDEKYHELVDGSSPTDMLIHYTVTPAYIVILAHTEEVLDDDVLVKAKVVMHSNQTSEPDQQKNI